MIFIAEGSIFVPYKYHRVEVETGKPIALTCIIFNAFLCRVMEACANLRFQWSASLGWLV